MKTRTAEDGTVQVIQLAEHKGHEADCSKCLRDRILHKVRTGTEDAPLQKRKNVIADIVNECSLSEQPLLPSALAMQRVASRLRSTRRRRLYGTFDDEGTTTLESLQIPPEMCTLQGQSILLHDTGPSADRILVFAANRNIDVLTQADSIIGDGTFETCPHLWAQKYQLHVVKNGFPISVVTALLPGKRRCDYVRLLKYLHRTAGLERCTWIIDFEQSMAQAIYDVFGHHRIGYCFFHLCQSIFRKVANLGFKSRYFNDASFRHRVFCMSSLAFLPPELIEPSWPLVASMFQEDEVQLRTYFETNYIGEPDLVRGSGRKHPRFSPVLWSVYSRRLRGLQVTTNVAERSHSFQAKTLITPRHPKMGEFIEGLLRDQAGVDLMLGCVARGDHRVPTRSFVDKTTRVEVLLQELRGTRDVKDFLCKLSYQRMVWNPNAQDWKYCAVEDLSPNQTFDAMCDIQGVDGQQIERPSEPQRSDVQDFQPIEAPRDLQRRDVEDQNVMPDVDSQAAGMPTPSGPTRCHPKHRLYRRSVAGLAKKGVYNVSCDRCRCLLLNGFFFCCDPCRFRICRHCVGVPSEDKRIILEPAAHETIQEL